MKDLIYFLSVLRANKKVSHRLYDKLLKNDEIPRKVKSLVKKVWEKQQQQSGGDQITININDWIITTEKELGSGSFGSVYTFRVGETHIKDRAIKIFNDRISNKISDILYNINLLFSGEYKDNIDILTSFSEYDRHRTISDQKTIFGYFLKKCDGDLTKILNSKKEGNQSIVNTCIDNIMTLNNLGIINGDIKRSNILYQTNTGSITIYIHDFDDVYICNVSDLLKPIEGYREIHDKKNVPMVTPLYMHPIYYMFRMGVLKLDNSDIIKDNTIKIGGIKRNSPNTRTDYVFEGQMSIILQNLSFNKMNYFPKGTTAEKLFEQINEIRENICKRLLSTNLTNDDELQQLTELANKIRSELTESESTMSGGGGENTNQSSMSCASSNGSYDIFDNVFKIYFDIHQYYLLYLSKLTTDQATLHIQYSDVFSFAADIIVNLDDSYVKQYLYDYFNFNLTSMKFLSNINQSMKKLKVSSAGSSCKKTNNMNNMPQTKASKQRGGVEEGEEYNPDKKVELRIYNPEHLQELCKAAQAAQAKKQNAPKTK